MLLSGEAGRNRTKISGDDKEADNVIQVRGVDVAHCQA
jgi:hypothetical protein